MELNKQTVEYLANLARIQLQPEELEKLSRQLRDILDFIDKLKKADVSQVSPTSHILPLKNVLREDIPGNSLKIEDTLMNAPAKEGNFFSVPKVIE